MFSATALPAPLAAVAQRLRQLLRLQPRSPPLAPQHLLQLLQQMDKASHRRQVLELSQLAALLPLDAPQRLQLVASTPSPKSSGSRRQTAQSIRSRQRRR